MNMEHFDVIIVGAGLSGIGAGVHLKRECPDQSFVILESREVSGGTWDLFRYPGVRSDSDMYTLGYALRHWLHQRLMDLQERFDLRVRLPLAHAHGENSDTPMHTTA